MMTSSSSPDDEILCNAPSSFPDRPDEASPDVGHKRASARTAPHTALLDGFDIPLLIHKPCSDPNTARTDPLCKSTLLGSGLNSVTYSITTSSATDAFGGLLQVWNTAHLHKSCRTVLSAFVFSLLRRCPVMEQGVTDYGAKGRRLWSPKPRLGPRSPEHGPRKIGTLPSPVCHRPQELRVVLRLAHLRQQQLHRLSGRQRRQDLAKHPHAVEVVLRNEHLFLARAALLDVD